MQIEVRAEKEGHAPIVVLYPILGENFLGVLAKAIQGVSYKQLCDLLANNQIQYTNKYLVTFTVTIFKGYGSECKHDAGWLKMWDNPFARKCSLCGVVFDTRG